MRLVHICFGVRRKAVNGDAKRPERCNNRMRIGSAFLKLLPGQRLHSLPLLKLLSLRCQLLPVLLQTLLHILTVQRELQMRQPYDSPCKCLTMTSANFPCLPIFMKESKAIILMEMHLLPQ